MAERSAIDSMRHRILMLSMLLALTTCIAALFGLAFGSFLNVCATRMPEDESVVSPGSHCRSCSHVLRWHENIPVLSWIILRGRCSACRAPIPWHYPLLELMVAITWGVIAWQTTLQLLADELSQAAIFEACVAAVGKMILCWLLVLLAALDAEHLWLPNKLTIGGSVLGVPFALARFGVRAAGPSNLVNEFKSSAVTSELLHWLIGIVVAPSIILLVRWSYRLLRRQEGIGLGDAKLMLLLAVWLGLAHTLLAFVMGVFCGTAFALFILIVPRARRDNTGWLHNRIPLGTFLCIGGIFSALWGTPIIADYLRTLGM